MSARAAPTQRSEAASTGDDIGARIAAHAGHLTESERRLADVVLEAASDLSGLTAGELAARAEVSAATAARFFRRLGYENYGAARRAARTGRALGSPFDEYGRRAGGQGDFAAHIAADIENLTRLAETVAPERLAEAVARLAGARRVFILGFRNSGALAGYLRGLLAHVKDDVRLLPLAGQTLAEDMAGLGDDDVLVVVGFRRRPPVLREILAVARDARAPSILITDSTAVRTAQLADVALRCPNRGSSFFDSYVAPLCLCNHLAAAVGAALGPGVECRLARIEALHRRLDPFLAGPSGEVGRQL